VNLAGQNVVRDGGTSDRLTQWGLVVQGGVFVAEPVELYAPLRVRQSRHRSVPHGVEQQARRPREGQHRHVGVVWFPLGITHKELKWSSDIGYAFTPIGDFNSSGANWLPDATGANQSERRRAVCHSVAGAADF
jgi:hypothetical protein